MISLDTETTGVDLNHGAEPYFVSTCDSDMNQLYWEWDVDPLTREVIIPDGNLKDIGRFLRDKDLVLHNSVFDAKALSRIGIDLDWDRIDDTLPASHLLSSNTPHDLTSLSMRYLGINVQPYEDEVKLATNQARDLAKRYLPEWRIAKAGMKDMPSVKSDKGNTARGAEGESYWKADMWLLRSMVKLAPELLPKRSVARKGVKSRPWLNTASNAAWEPTNDPETHEWATLTKEYANSDTAVTIMLWESMQKLLEESSLRRLYDERRKILRIVFLMEQKGITINLDRMRELQTDYIQYVKKSEKNLKKIALKYDYDLEVPKGANNNSLSHFCFGYEPNFKGDGKTSCKLCGKDSPKTDIGLLSWREKSGSQEELYCSKRCYEGRKSGSWLDLPVVAYSDSGLPTTNKKAMQIYADVLTEPDHVDFISNLSVKRKLGKSLEYLESYKRFYLHPRNKSLLPEESRRIRSRRRLRGDVWRQLFPSLNPFGTDTLRWSSHNPSQQVISKQKDHNGRNLRYVFGPQPGRVWYSLDYDNLELRIPAYECQEPAMLELFENPDKAPFYGSYHMLIASILHPEMWEPILNEVGLDNVASTFKDRYASTWYSWTKNGNFADQYGAVDTGDGRGTADVAFHKPGAQAIISAKLTKKNELNRYWIDYARKYGYVETMPDLQVDPTRGYPIQCKMNSWGKVIETTPLNYHVQGTACWVVMRAMIKIQELLDVWNSGLPKPEYFMVMNIHDEVILDFPSNMVNGRDKNFPKVLAVRKAMESIGKDIKVKLTCGLDRHEESWLYGVSL